MAETQAGATAPTETTYTFRFVEKPDELDVVKLVGTATKTVRDGARSAHEVGARVSGPAADVLRMQLDALAETTFAFGLELPKAA